jgi:hypothetical protein
VWDGFVKYNIALICFDAFQGRTRLPHDESRQIFDRIGVPGAYVISDGGPISITDALSALGDMGHHGATETVEGVVWRVERKGEFGFMAKYVRHDKKDGKYLPSITGEPPIVMIHALSP